MSTQLPQHGADQNLMATLGDCTRAAVSETLGAICGEAPRIHEDPPTAEVGEGLIGVISLSGHRPVAMMLGLPRPTAESVTAKFAGFPIAYESADMGDAVGELANVLAGDLAARLDREGIAATLGLPSVVRGIHVEAVPLHKGASRVLRYRAPQGDFWVRLTVESSGAAATMHART